MRTIHISLTIHISMTSTFQCENCQCFTFKRCDNSKLKWLVISTYTLRCSLSTIHARSSIQLIHLSGLCSPIRVMPNDQNRAKVRSFRLKKAKRLQVIVEATQQPLIKCFPCLRIFLRKIRRKRKGNRAKE